MQRACAKSKKEENGRGHLPSDESYRLPFDSLPGAEFGASVGLTLLAGGDVKPAVEVGGFFLERVAGDFLAGEGFVLGRGDLTGVGRGIWDLADGVRDRF